MEGAQLKELQNPYDALQTTDDEEGDDAANKGSKAAEE